eukprot:scaffold602_cov179-Ochromonas_danica.AAC.13
MGNCCGKKANEGSVAYRDGGGNSNEYLSPEELERRRKLQAEAAEQRSRQFQQGGGGEKLKVKSKALEQAEKKNADLGGPPALKWTV